MPTLPRAPRVIAPFALALSMVACGGGTDGIGPGDGGPRPTATDSIGFTVPSSFLAVPSYAPLATADVRLYGVDGAQRTLIARREVPVSGTTQLAMMTFRMPLPANAPASGLLEVELLGATSSRAEWSARSNSFPLTRGTTVAQSLTFGRGPVAALDTRQVTLSVASTELVAGDSTGVTVTADAITESLDTTIVRMEGTRLLRAVRRGSARVVAAAGLVADTVTVQVTAPPTEIILDRTQARVPSLNTWIRFRATLRRADSSVVTAPVAVTWSSSDTTILRSVGQGIFESVREGMVLATARAATFGLATNATVEVRQLPHSAVVTPATGVLPASGKTQPLLEVSAKDAMGYPITRPLVWSWYASGPVTITAESPGAPRARLKTTNTAIGDASIRAIWEEGSAYAIGEANWNILPTLSQMTLGLSFIVGVGRTHPLQAQGFYSPTSPRYTIPARWSSSNTSIATVDSTGVVTGVSMGDAVITATSDAFSLAASVPVLVRPPVTSIEIVSGDMQDGAPGAYLAAPLVVLVRGADGQPVEGARITWTEQGNRFDPPATVSTSKGTASQQWRLNGLPRTAFATATVDGMGVSTRFTARVSPLEVGPVLIVQQFPLVVTTGARMSPGAVVALADNAGRRVEYGGTSVRVQVNTGDAVLSGTTTVPVDALGVARFDDLVLTGKAGTKVRLRFVSPEGKFTDTNEITLQ